ncbi:MAG: serine hydrolase domain-containing protein [Thermoanaerobaculia bacterium]|jgi:CubicO group peptidase (beta-lactamase class C family)
MTARTRITLTLVTVLLVATSLAAQPKRVEIGGRQGPDPTTDWPHAQNRPEMTDAERIASFDTLLGELTKEDLFAGAVLVAKDGKPVLRKAYGLANRELGVANTPETKFNIGSINKDFTRDAIRLLAKDGKLSLSDTIAKHLPDYTGAGADRITIAQLLEHESGLGDFFGEQFQKTPKGDLRSLQDFVPFFVDKPLEFEPGKGRRYSNAGFVVLGLIVEKVSGKSYYDFVRERVYAPLGMNDSGSWQVDEIAPGRATGYTKRGPTGPLTTLRSNIGLLPGRPSSAGGGMSTVDDLLRYANGLRSDALGLGTVGGFGTAGGLPGANAALELCDGGVTIIAMANVDPPAAEFIAEQGRKLFGCPGE